MNKVSKVIYSHLSNKYNWRDWFVAVWSIKGSSDDYYIADTPINPLFLTPVLGVSGLPVQGILKIDQNCVAGKPIFSSTYRKKLEKNGKYGIYVSSVSADAPLTKHFNLAGDLLKDKNAKYIHGQAVGKYHARIITGNDICYPTIGVFKEGTYAFKAPSKRKMTSYQRTYVITSSPCTGFSFCRPDTTDYSTFHIIVLG